MNATEYLNQKDWNKGFDLGFAGVTPKRLIPGTKVSRAFVSGHSAGIEAKIVSLKPVEPIKVPRRRTKKAAI